MQLVAAQSKAVESSVLSRCPKVALRVRPGERPMFVDVPTATAERWLAGARAAEVVLDCWVAVCLERRLIERALRPARPQIVAAFDEACQSSPLALLAPSEPLRAWRHQLAASVDAVPATSVVLPERVAVRARGELFDPCPTEWGRRALRWEHEAAGHGETMEAWALRLAVAVLASRQ